VKCQQGIDRIISEVRTFGAEMLGTDNIGTCKASIEAIRALRRLNEAIADEACQDYEWPTQGEAPEHG
jgi:hypothetical protein